MGAGLMVVVRASLAILLMIPAIWLCKAAQWICPEAKESPARAHDNKFWLNAMDDWGTRKH
jgi:hypothetical protein